MRHPPQEDPLSRTDILKAEFGKSWRAWAWVKRQFSPISLTTLGGVLAVAGGWIIHLNTRVVVLETRVLPVIMDEAAVKILQGKVDDHENRISDLEQTIGHATEVSHTAPNAKRK